MATQPHPSPFLSPSELWEALGRRVGRQAIYEALNGGRIRCMRIGRKYLIPRTEIEDWPNREMTLGADDGLTYTEAPWR